MSDPTIFLPLVRMHHTRQQLPEDMRYRPFRASNGFSMVELMVVMGIIAILSIISLPYIVNYKKLYKSEDQAIKMMDLMRETAQMALTRRRTFRFEIDLTDNVVLVIDENNSATDKLVKKIPLEMVGDVRVDAKPATINRPDPPNYTDIVYVTDSIGHLQGTTSVTGHNVWRARFRSDGSVVNAANNPINQNIYIWPPVTPGSSTPRNKGEVRCITLSGAAGAIRYWRHNGTTFQAYQ